MKIESPEYTWANWSEFMNEMEGHDRLVLADRLERASRRLAETATRIEAGRSDGGEWSPVEVLAHIASLSKFYGVMLHRIITGQVTDLTAFLQAAQMRDGAIDQLADKEPAELVRMSLADHARTVAELRSADPAALRRAASLPEGSMTAEEVARLPLISHVEMHLDQLEKLLA